MKKKNLFIVLLCAAVLLAAGVLFMMKNSISFSTGSCIAADNGRCAGGYPCRTSGNGMDLPVM